VGTLTYTYKVTVPNEGSETTIPAGGSITLASNGVYSITFKAYADTDKTKLVASKSVSGISVANGTISGTATGGTLTGSTLSVVLDPVQDGDGILSFDITLGDVAGSGTLSLFKADGTTAATTTEGNGWTATGVYTFSEENPLEAIPLAAGRYVVRIELTDESGDVALYREPVVIWTNLTTTLK
jgi:hypothetical protein